MWYLAASLWQQASLGHSTTRVRAIPVPAVPLRRPWHAQSPAPRPQARRRPPIAVLAERAHATPGSVFTRSAEACTGAGTTGRRLRRRSRCSSARRKRYFAGLFLPCVAPAVVVPVPRAAVAARLLEPGLLAEGISHKVVTPSPTGSPAAWSARRGRPPVTIRIHPGRDTGTASAAPVV
jgi:hypothetical protein